jgi:L,D-transpeptidase ErfK/SrfK
VVGVLLSGLAQPAPPPAVQLAGGPVDYCVAAGDSLESLAARFGVDAATIARRNGLDPRGRLRAGRAVRIDAVHLVPSSDRPVVVNLPQRMLFVRTAEGVRAFPIAAGRPGWQTPRGPFTIVEKEEDPTWDVPVSIQREMERTGKPVLTHVAPGPENPLGKFFLRTSLPNIGIHGTNAPRSIHRLVTHGCIRVHPDLIGDLFALVPAGTEGEVVYRPVLVGVVGGRVYIEVNPDAYGCAPLTLSALRDAAEQAAASASIDWALAADALKLREGVAVDVTAK